MGRFLLVRIEAHIGPATGTGVRRSVLVPSPSWPKELPPQQ
jgi:hypothetical protein